MKTEWDYSDLAEAYLKRPDYADEAVDRIFELAGLAPGMAACDIGAGTAHLTLHLLRRGLAVTAVEPNDEMRRRGAARTRDWPGTAWVEAAAEKTGLPSGSFDLVAFGSSFNVTDRPAALRETARLLRDGGWFVCLWNHRDLSDPVQAGIEAVIREKVEGYGYGARREDQTPVIEASGLFHPVVRIEGRVVHRQSKTDCKEAWASHATLQRQAGDRFAEVLAGIDAYLDRLPGDVLQIPYDTRAFAARKK